ncbi:MAG: NADH-quinone oxidoreductase subunit NuoB [Desulfobulbaceae bacterium]|nr:NADH-quinone oxidoreductase subunit NuoB [Desulfobulbaceae bacterium]
MFSIIRERLRQGYRTSDFPRREPKMMERFRGVPIINAGKCVAECDACVNNCPHGAMTRTEQGPTVDLGRCLFCADCSVCPQGAMEPGNDYRLAASSRKDLLMDREGPQLAKALNKKMLALFGRSLKLRLVSAGGCNGCEADLNVLGTLVYDLGRFGIQFVASPRHADGLIVTGPVTENMRAALLATYEAMPAPKLVIAAGACAISGGAYRDEGEVHNGVTDLLPVDLFIPGCPPHPYTTLDGLLRMLDKRG